MPQRTTPRLPRSKAPTASYITDHTDDISRAALLEYERARHRQHRFDRRALTMADPGIMITPASPEWVLLSAVYHHVLAQSASPEAAQIDIATAHRNGQLRWRCTLGEHKAVPHLRLSPGESPPQPAPTLTMDYPIPPDTKFGTFDWERSHAFSPNDPVTRSVYEYLDIISHRDDALALWPVGAPSAASDEPRSDESKRDAAMRVLDELDSEAAETEGRNHEAYHSPRHHRRPSARA